jgi:hypothetical protein
VTRLGILLLRPVEAYWGWSVRRAYRTGKYRRPDWAADQGKPCVTTKQ